jgi:hypothetical protein
MTTGEGGPRRSCHGRRLGRVAAAAGLAAGLLAADGPGPARADAEADLFDLLMAWESVSICDFAMPEDAAERVDAAIRGNLAELGRDEAELDALREQAAWQLLRQRRAMCAADGGWRARYDELLAGLPAATGG